MGIKNQEIEKSINRFRKKEKVNVLKPIYWKSESILWRIINILSFVVALLVSYLVPAKQNLNLSPYRILIVIIIAIFIILNVVSHYNAKIYYKTNHNAQLFSAIGVIISVWDLVTSKFALLPLPFFPSIGQIIQEMVGDYSTLLISTTSSMKLLFVGFTAGIILGLVSGVLMGWYRQFQYWLFPLVKIIGVIPATAWIPIVMFIFPSSFYAQAFLIVLCVWFPVAFMTSSGIQNLPKSYFEAARTLGAKESFLVFRVAIPGAMPSIFTGIYTATGVSFATLVVSEMIGAKAGLGWYINWARGWSNYAKVYASIIIMGIVFSIVMAIIFKLRDRVLIWQKGLLK